VPALVRFLSMEPLLGPVRFDAVPVLAADYGYDASPIDWVIVGGESGCRARPLHPDWARSIRDQCTRGGVPFFFKQWGEWEPHDADATIDSPSMDHVGACRLADGHEPPWRDGWAWGPDQHGIGRYSWRTGKRAAGRLLDGRTWDEVPS